MQKPMTPIFLLASTAPWPSSQPANAVASVTTASGVMFRGTEASGATAANSSSFSSTTLPLMSR